MRLLWHITRSGSNELPGKYSVYPKRSGSSMNQNVKRVFAITLVVLLAGLEFMPIFSSRAANRERRDQHDKLSGESRENFTPHRKIAVELEEQIEQEAIRPAKKNNKLQRIIIKLRDNRSDSEQILLQTASEEFRAQILQSKSDANEMRATALSARIEELNGRFGAAFNNLGMMSVELPLA